MNMRTQHSGSIAGVVPNPPGNPLPGPLQQNGNIFPSQTQNPGIHCNALNRNLELAKARKYMQAKIYEILMRRSRQSPDLSQKKMIDIVKRLEEGLFRSALSQEEYLNMATLESRLHILIKRPSMNKDNQQFSHASSSLSVGTMIPTPGFPQTVNSVLMSTSMDSSAVSTNGSNTMVSSCINNGSFFLTGNGPSGSGRGGFFNSTDGPSSGVCQQSNAFSINSGGIDLVTSMGVQKIGSQMIPTPGFNHPNNDGVNTDATNQRFMNPESSKNCSMFPNIEASIASLPTQQRTQFDGQNSHSIRNIGVPIGSAIRPTFEQRPKVLSNGPMNGGMGMIGNDISPMNSAETSEGYTTGTMYNNSVQPLLANFDQHHHPIMQGDGYETRAADASESGNFYVPVTSVGSMTNNECLGATTPQSMPKSNSPPMTNAPIIHFTGPAKPLETQSIDHLEKLNHLSQNPEKESDVQHLQHQQLQQPCSPFHHQQIVRLQKQQNENQLLSKNNSFSRPHLSSNIIPDYKSGSEREHRDDALHFQISEPSEFSRNWFQQNSMEDHYRATPFTQNSDQMQQLMHWQHFEANPQNNFKSMSGGTRDDSALCGQGYSNSQDGSHVGETLKHVKTVREDFGHEVSGIGGYQRNNIRSEESVIAQCDASISTEPPAVSSALSRSNYISRERQFKNQQRWLLFLLHARRCSAPEGKCQEPNCILAQKLLAHLDYCNAIKCQFPRCDVTKDLLIHRRHCQDASCPVCIPVKNFVLAQRKAFASSDFRPGLHCNVNGSSKTCNTAEITGRSILKTSSLKPETPEDLEPSRKRVKTEETSKIFVSESERSDALVTDIKSELPLRDAERPEEHDVSHIPVQSASSEIKVEIGGSDWKSNHKSMERKNDRLDDTCGVRTDSDPTLSSNPAGIGSQEVIQVEKEIEQSKPQNILIPCDNASKSGKAKVTGVSLTELFTPEQIQEHIKGLRQWVGQSKAKAEKNQAMEHLMNENSCQLCAVEKLKFEPPPIYCTRCGTRIKRNAMYYTFGAGDTRHYFCIPCYNDARGDTIVVDRTTIPKARVEKKKNDDEIVEPWVQCDKCEAWQHQICALFNGKRNDGQAEYTCPNCYIEEVERGERVPLPRSAVLGAKDLPKTILSDHLEQRLFSRLKHERQERALLQGKAYDEVPGAEALVVRVVSSVDKKLEVKPRFFEIFQDQNYPTEFPYKSKVILLFQNIEGVEVCLFGMYVQEFGSECQQPNHRRVYLAYLDSVKYFRPDVRAVTGEALRTFVYHEILIGYLDYCKKRGFTSCYIWACPPMKGEDYILYCHPEIQKTPKSDKLREWYLSMLKKAERENIVVGLTNLYDHFFVCTGESRAKVTAARLPYFDGDYWPGSAEDIIYQLQQEDDGTKQHQKGNLKKSIIKRALKASGQTDLTGSTSKDLLLLHKLGETISPMKEDFIMVHLQHACTHCCILMISGNRWVCKRCKNFQLCDKCYDAEQKRDDRERHPVNHKDKHVLHPVQIIGVPDDTKDRDDILESEFFDTRHAFLNLCQGNHYQYDTLRRAKHSSMMILYHLHNPTAPAFVATCCICRLDIESGQGWRCETCLDYNVCNTCYQREGGIDHPHILTNNLSNDRDVQNIEARELRVVQLRKMLDLVVHASVCHSPSCQYPNCRGVKGLFHHAKLCKKRAVGGCVPCRRMWRILQIHSQTCKESECRVPRCRDLRVHVRRLQQQSESRRRAAATEMMRQRALEIAGCS